MMNPELKAKWVASLRSGDYPQSIARLKQSDGWCCLGVLCDVSGLGTWRLESVTDDKEVYAFVPNNPTLVPDIAIIPTGLFPKDENVNWRNPRFSDDNPKLALISDPKYYGYKVLTLINDWGLDFATMADLIEADPCL